MTSVSVSRVTRSNRDLRLAVLLALACAAGSVVLRAQEAPPDKPAAVTGTPTEAASTATAESAPAGATPAGATEDSEIIEFPDAPDPTASPPPPASGSSASGAGAPQATTAPAEPGEEGPPPDAAPRTPGVVGPTPGRFDPTEKVRADFDVSFPVDI